MSKMIERRFMKQFRGWESPWEEVDFETRSCLFEVKSCRLFTKTTSKSGSNMHLGRFYINTNNHLKLYLRSLQVDKIPKYIFAVRHGKQLLYTSKHYHELDFITNDKPYYNVPIQKIFTEGINGN